MYDRKFRKVKNDLITLSLRFSCIVFQGNRIFSASMKAILNILLVTGLILISTQIGWARHIVGGEIYYDYNGPGTAPNTNSYTFTMKLYRDCASNGALFDTPAEFGLYTFINGQYSFVRTYQIPRGPVSRLSTHENPCLILPPDVCVEQTSYVFTINNLPIIQGSYILSWQRCCRNNSINNILAPEDTGATYTIEITEAGQLAEGSGPRFNLFPDIGICVNDPIDFDHSADDPEGDLLVYEFCAPLKGGGPLGVENPMQQRLCNGIIPNPANCPPPYEDVDFRTPNFTRFSPLGLSAGMQINATTGFITGTPVLTGQFVVGVCVKEYRNGQLLSVLQRDFQYNVVNCERTVEAFIEADALTTDDEFVINSCGKSVIDFINLSERQEFITDYKWTFDINGTNVVKTTRNATFEFPGVGNYRGLMIVNEGRPCGDTASLAINIYPGMYTEFEFDYDTCVAGPVSFTDLSQTNANAIEYWEWNFGDTHSGDTKNPSHLYQTAGVHPVSLISEDNNKCRDTAVHFVSYFPVPQALIINPDRFTDCIPTTVTFNNLSIPIDETYDINWDFGDGNTSTEISPVHTYTEPGTYSVNVDVTSPIGCYLETDFVDFLNLKPSPISEFSFSPEKVSTINNVVNFDDQSTGGSSWYWDFGGVGRSYQREPTFTFQDSGSYEVKQIVFHENGCSDTSIQILDVEPIVQFFLPNAFTPNQDGKNEVYRPAGLHEGVKEYAFTIWSRWGEKIFETTDPQSGWNGKFKNTGEELPVGVYMCVLQFVDARNRPGELKEFVTLIR